MKIVIPTIMTLLLVIGLGFCIYKQEWIGVFVNAAFMLQFAQKTIRECQEQDCREKERVLNKRKLVNATRKIAQLEKTLARYRG